MPNDACAVARIGVEVHLVAYVKSTQAPSSRCALAPDQAGVNAPCHPVAIDPTCTGLMRIKGWRTGGAHNGTSAMLALSATWNAAMSTEPTQYTLPFLELQHRRLEDRDRFLTQQLEDGMTAAAGAPTSDREVEDFAEVAQRGQRRIDLDSGRQRARRELTLVIEALTRLSLGVYGDCIECGASIPAPRLAIEPAAARCLDCQSRAEAH